MSKCIATVLILFPISCQLPPYPDQAPDDQEDHCACGCNANDEPGKAPTSVFRIKEGVRIETLGRVGHVGQC